MSFSFSWLDCCFILLGMIWRSHSVFLSLFASCFLIFISLIIEFRAIFLSPNFSAWLTVRPKCFSTKRALNLSFDFQVSNSNCNSDSVQFNLRSKIVQKNLTWPCEWVIITIARTNTEEKQLRKNKHKPCWENSTQNLYIIKFRKYNANTDFY